MATSSPAPASPLTADQQAALRAAWQRTPVTAILKSHWKAGTATVVTVTSSMAVEDAFDQLVKHNINAAPIFDEERQEYIGMVTMHDLVEYVVTLVKANKSVWQELDAELGPLSPASESPATVAKKPAHTPEGPAISEIVSRIRQVRPVPVSYISDLAQRDPYTALPSTATLDEAMTIFATGIHRIVISAADDPKSKTHVGILTQSDMIRWISEHEKEAPLDAIVKLKLADLHLSNPKPIIHVTAFQPVVDALQAMHTHRVSSVAIVDGTDRLLGNISASDVKHIMRHLRYGILFEPCSQFINKVKTRQMLENAGKDIVPVIQVSAHALLAQVLRLLIVTHVHRVWCTQQNPQAANFQAPISVVSMTDILRVLA
ncbi:hypothetical protein AMAG_03192 [Allomyces macrogynus ATCC 38327]|uniref:CBS domain-containing protein n=1 Tax=Allomyces macrogynus (strain ATCC 38327) TaxID=578462 RepID=A0A0L0S4P2_ALLM3|nr:hypothetical protein AMAG_03192 [Allomyces macrogynus ATCC 38327]|eukprot:KNE57483.1 hypothetical protein AMAG_03192 [Allomyces macrogynus ATCC 38327]